MTQEGQLLTWISRRLLDGFKRGLLCHSRKLLVEGKPRILFLFMSNSSRPERYAWNVKIQGFPNILPYFDVKFHCRLKNIESSPLFAPTTGVSPTPSSNSFSVSSKHQFSGSLQCSLKPSKLGGGRFLQNSVFILFWTVLSNRPDMFFGHFGLHSRP